MANSSWFIGFDKAGNPISGLETFKRDGSLAAMKREGCYLFKKLNHLITTAQLFPEAMNLNSTVTPDSNSNNNNIKGDENKSAGADRTTASQSAAALSTKLQGPTNVHSFNQRQLVNMTRYRNILRYQLRRKLNQPLVAIVDTTTNTASSNSSNLGSSSARSQLIKRKKARKRMIGQHDNDDSNKSTTTTTITSLVERTPTASWTYGRHTTAEVVDEVANRHHNRVHPRPPNSPIPPSSSGEPVELMRTNRKPINGHWDSAMENFSKLSALASAA